MKKLLSVVAVLMVTLCVSTAFAYDKANFEDSVWNYTTTHSGGYGDTYWYMITSCEMSLYGNGEFTNECTHDSSTTYVPPTSMSGTWSFKNNMIVVRAIYDASGQHVMLRYRPMNENTLRDVKNKTVYKRAW